MTTFSKKVFDLLLQVPAGKVTTYKALALAMNTKAYQAIGQVLKNNLDSPRIPCHRVVKSNGKLGGFMGQKDGSYVMKKSQLLQQEGVECKNGVIKNFKQHLFTEFDH